MTCCLPAKSAGGSYSQAEKTEGQTFIVGDDLPHPKTAPPLRLPPGALTCLHLSSPPVLSFTIPLGGAQCSDMSLTSVQQLFCIRHRVKGLRYVIEPSQQFCRQGFCPPYRCSRKMPSVRFPHKEPTKTLADTARLTTYKTVGDGDGVLLSSVN